jgi:hypothetical protein
MIVEVLESYHPSNLHLTRAHITPATPVSLMVTQVLFPIIVVLQMNHVACQLPLQVEKTVHQVLLKLAHLEDISEIQF